jgi:lipoprotein-anchoring transpeptidase ErfK/SrfK
VALGPGETRTLSIVDARTADGGWLAEPRTIELSAPPPLKLAAVWPAPGEQGVSPAADPTFRFSEPVADRQAAEGAIRFDPPVAGKFEWLSPERVHFVPDGSFPSQTNVAVHIASGPQGVVGVSGSYLSEGVQVGFTTGKRKVIDVALASQKMTLYEEDDAVWSAPVATGVRGAETPPGTYRVEYKMPIARFRGVNPSGSRYDIPDVHWVMAFYGDYTIHGAYWRHNFGTPGSAGCISLTDANAKHVFDWAQEGTVVRVHP